MNYLKINLSIKTCIDHSKGVLGFWGNAIKHMPILEERKKLSKNERMKLDLERMKAESSLAVKIKADVELLLIRLIRLMFKILQSKTMSSTFQ